MNKFDDYIILESLSVNYANDMVKVKCSICGHEKVILKRNLKHQRLYHDSTNCKDDYFKTIVGSKNCDYEAIDYYKKEQQFFVKCRCSQCKKEHDYSISDFEHRQLKHNRSRCGDFYYSAYINKQYGDFKIISVLDEKVYSDRYCICECQKCGEHIKRKINAVMKENPLHGNICFEQIDDPEFVDVFKNRYWNMHSRCNNPNNSHYKDYGERGIQCEYKSAIDLYHDFIDEFKQYSKTHDIRDCTFDRIDVNGNYTKTNLRIASKHIQGANKRTRRFFIMKNTKTNETVIADSIGEFGRKYNINPSAVSNTIVGRSKSCGKNWICINSFTDETKIKENILNENVTTNLIISL